MSFVRHSIKHVELRILGVLNYIQSIFAIDFTQPATREAKWAKFHEEIPYEKRVRMLAFGRATLKMMRLVNGPHIYPIYVGSTSLKVQSRPGNVEQSSILDFVNLCKPRRS